MEATPLAARLKRRNHRQTALLQDILVAQAYDSFPTCILHGGTAIWRCYGGGRFSKDVDAYLPEYSDEAAGRFRRGLGSKGLEELKFKATRNTVFGSYALAGASVEFEAALRGPRGRVIRPYEKLEGGYMLVATLSPDELVEEKASAYAERRKVRDLYDIFFLLGKVEDKRGVRKSAGSLLAKYQSPVDEAQLKAIVITGAVPSAEDMAEGIRWWARRST